VIGQGWAADEFLAFHHQGGVPWPERPDLENAGLIAYIGPDSNIWLMNADSSRQRAIVRRAGDSEYFSSLAWSPAGNQLSFTFTLCCPSGSGTRIVDLNGNLVVELAGLTGARWSPDGNRLSALRHHSAAGLGDNNTPVVFDLNAGAETTLGSPTYSDTAPAWSPDGTQVTFVCTSSTAFTTAPDGTSVETRLDCGGDGLRIVPATGGDPRIILPFTPESGVYYRNPSWSGNGATIAVVNHAQGHGCRGYTLVDVQTGELGSCIAFPPNGNRGGGCGWPADGSTWSQDGRYLIYSYTMGNGSNGINVVEISTGRTTLVPGLGTASPSLQSTAQNLTYAAGGHIWVAGLDGSNLTLLAEGNAPAWQPLP
jgi:Tol biopolymer transport system component